MNLKSVSQNWVCWHESEKRQSKLSVLILRKSGSRNLLTWSWRASVETECVDVKLRASVETECVDMKVKSVSGKWVCWHETEERQWKMNVLAWSWERNWVCWTEAESISGNWVCWREEELQVMAWRTQHASDHWQLFPLGYPVRAIDLLSCLHRIRGRRNELKEINKGTNWLAASELEYYTSQMGLENKDVFSRW